MAAKYVKRKFISAMKWELINTKLQQKFYYQWAVISRKVNTYPN
jgi:hypothetical protein